MICLQQTQNKENEGDSWKSRVTIKRGLVLLAGLCILCLVGGVTYYYQHRNGSGVTIQNNPVVKEKSGNAENMARSMDELANVPTIWPVSGAITSNFGWRNCPLEDGGELHPGIDIAYDAGLPVVATADGKVVKSGWGGGYGNMVQIDHGNGIETIYGHNSQLLVSAGQEVRKGQVISYAGSTGKSTGPHVHYEVREKGVAVNPFKYMVMFN